MSNPSIVTRSLEATFVPISPGVELRVLRHHAEGGMTFLVRMQPGSRAVRHEHPGGEETYVLEGALQIVDRVDAAQRPQPDLCLAAGDHAFVPPGEVHAGYAEVATVFLVIAPGGLVRTT